MSSKKSVCHFLLMIDSNLGPIFHGFRDMASFLLNFSSFPHHLIPDLNMFSLHEIAKILRAQV